MPTSDTTDTRGRAAATALAVALLAACRDPAPAATATVMEVRAGDYAFTAPTEVPAGLVTLRMAADGRELHHAQVVRFEEGHSLADLLAELRTGEGPLPPWVRLLGGVNGADPGATAETSMMLEPGPHALLCLIPARDGAPHLAKGMMHAFAVTPPAVRIATLPADVRVLMTAAGFDMPDPVPAGPVTLERGAWNAVHTELSPGRHVLVDFTPHPSDGRPQAAHGMAREFDVR